MCWLQHLLLFQEASACVWIQHLTWTLHEINSLLATGGFLCGRKYDISQCLRAACHALSSLGLKRTRKCGPNSATQRPPGIGPTPRHLRPPTNHRSGATKMPAATTARRGNVPPPCPPSCSHFSPSLRFTNLPRETCGVEVVVLRSWPL